MKKTSALGVLLLLSIIGLIASAWLGCALSDRWTFACQIQGVVFGMVAIFSAGHFVAESIA